MPDVPASGGVVSLGTIDIPAAATAVSILKGFPDIDTSAERVTAAWSGKASSVLIQADPDNTGLIFVGNSSTFDPTTKTGLVGVLAALAPGASMVIGSNESMNLVNLADIWLDTATNGNNAFVSCIRL